jgi:hypothetical protein
MKPRDTQPESPKTRCFEVPDEDPMTQARTEIFGNRMQGLADEVRDARPVMADLLAGAAAAEHDNDPGMSAPMVRVAYMLSLLEEEIPDAEGCAALLLDCAALVITRSVPMRDYLCGISAALGGEVVAPESATPAYRAGLRGSLDMLRGRLAGGTELVVAAEPARVAVAMVATADEDAPTGAHAAANPDTPDPEPPPLLSLDVDMDNDDTAIPQPRAKPIQSTAREADAPVFRGSMAAENEATRVHLIAKTHPLRGAVENNPGKVPPMPLRRRLR